MNHPNRIIAIVVVMVFALGLSIDLYTPSFPAIQDAFNTTTELTRLSITTYFCGYCVGLIVLGPISDAFGRKKPLLILILVYLIMSCLCIFSKNIASFLLFRLLQGGGASVIGISFRAILRDVFSGKELAKAMAYTSMSYRVGPIIAPVIGGYLQTFFGWQANFVFLMIYALVLIYIIGRHLPETHTEITPLESKTLYRRYAVILKNKGFIGAALCVGIQYGILLVFNLIAPFFLQEILHYSPIDYGHIAFVVGIFAFSGLACNRLLLHKYSHLTLIPTGIYAIAFSCLGGVVVTWLFPVTLWSFITPIFATLFFTGFMTSNMLSHAMNLFPKDKGIASSLQAVLIILTATALTSVGSFLSTHSALPFALFYLGAAIALLLGYKLLFIKS